MLAGASFTQFCRHGRPMPENYLKHDDALAAAWWLIRIWPLNTETWRWRMQIPTPPRHAESTKSIWRRRMAALTRMPTEEAWLYYSFMQNDSHTPHYAGEAMGMMRYERRRAMPAIQRRARQDISFFSAVLPPRRRFHNMRMILARYLTRRPMPQPCCMSRYRAAYQSPQLSTTIYYAR